MVIGSESGTDARSVEPRRGHGGTYKASYRYEGLVRRDEDDFACFFNLIQWKRYNLWMTVGL